MRKIPVIDVGAYLSGRPGALQSTAPVRRDRYAIPYFLGPHLDSEIGG